MHAKPWWWMCYWRICFNSWYRSSVLINFWSMISFIDFIFPYVYKSTRACVTCYLHNFDFVCGFEYANCMVGCEDKDYPAVTHIQIRNYRKWIWKFNLWDHWKLLLEQVDAPVGCYTACADRLTDVSEQPIGHIFKGHGSRSAWPLKAGPIGCPKCL